MSLSGVVERLIWEISVWLGCMEFPHHNHNIIKILRLHLKEDFDFIVKSKDR